MIRIHKSVLAGIVCFAIPLAVGSPVRGSGAADPAQLDTILQGIRDSEYRFARAADGSITAPNRAQGIRSYVTPTGLRIVPRDPGRGMWDLGLTLVGVGRGSVLDAPGDRELTVAESGTRVSLAGSRVSEWFVNERRGLEHGFNVFGRPPGAVGEEGAPLTLELTIEGDLIAELDPARAAVLFRAAENRTAVHYDSLHVVDARGRELPAWFELAGDRLRIVTDDRDAVYPVVVDPLVTMPDWSAEPNQALAAFGTALASGDINNDGFSDLIIGASNFDNPDPFINPHPDEGAVFLFKGSAGGPATSANWTVQADHAGAEFGISVATADTNGDGFDDIIIGASDYDDGSQFDEGSVFVFFGSPGLLGQATALNANWIAQSNQPFAEFGIRVARVGRVNNDIYEDIVIGAPDYTFDQTNEGAVFVYYGSANGPGNGVSGTPASANWSAQGNQVTSNFGSGLASAGDIDNNGYDDLIVGARDYELNFSVEGRVFLYRAANNGSGLEAAPIWTLEGNRNDARLGVSVGGAGDVNGDGFDDVIIGADDYSAGQVFEGAAFVFNGLATGLLGTTPAWHGQVDQTEAFFGFSVAGVGDVNGDGYGDVLVGADGFDDGEADEGAAFLYLGSPTGLPNAPTQTYELNLADTGFGVAVARAGDVDNDGYDDVVIGADLYTKIEIEEGAAFLFYGCEDSDRDGTCEAVDNCPEVINVNQLDTDGDGVGDVCDPCEDIDVDLVCDEPTVLVQGSGPGEAVLVQFGSPMRYFANVTTLNPGFDSIWMTPSFNASGWSTGFYGVGFETSAGEGAQNLILSNTGPNKISIYTRANFVISDPAEVQSMWLGVDYDDAFVAWINGTEVFRSGEMPAGPPAFDSAATVGHESSNGTVPDYGALNNISVNALDVLQSGVNVLAIGVWNTAPSSSDLVVVPRLSINRPVSSTMRYQANSVDPFLGVTWTQLGFDDSSWSAGNFGIGFETGSGAQNLINTDVPATARSVFSRARFNIALDAVQGIFLGADYDDGFIAWINGTEVYRSPQMGGTPGSVPAWNASPTPHESSNGFFPAYGTLLDISSAAGPALRNGSNILSVGVWTTSGAGADDMVVVPRLSVNEIDNDNCVGVNNPTQADLDQDGVGDACDPDIDGDGLNNGVDNCPFLVNNPAPDADLDGLGDACDICKNDPNNDQDNDLICVGAGFEPPKVGGFDNCPTVFNPGQADLDEDNLGDLCDPDIDNDGTPNETDNCVYEFNNPQTNADGDIRGAACDCNDSNNAVWERSSVIYPLRFTRSDVCFNFACTQSQGSCSGDSQCNFDQCTNKICSTGLNACVNNDDCAVDECANFVCSMSLDPCNSNNDCERDTCSTKTCSLGGNSCNVDNDCTADFCANKFCTEGLNSCTLQSDCVVSQTDFCIGQCSIGGNSCASNAACDDDVCRGVCSVGGNQCVNDSVCTMPQQDLCLGLCTLGGNVCANNDICTTPQTDLCFGTCSIGANSCMGPTDCTQPQTDLCRGRCSIGNNSCVVDTACTAPPQDLLVWNPPSNLGGTAVWYDTLRSTVASNFGVPASCVEINGPDGRTPAPATPAVGAVDFYLIRVENACPGIDGNMGTDLVNSIAHERTGRSCP